MLCQWFQLLRVMKVDGHINLQLHIQIQSRISRSLPKCIFQLEVFKITRDKWQFKSVNAVTLQSTNSSQDTTEFKLTSTTIKHMERDNSSIMALPRLLWLSSLLNKVNPNNPPSIYIPFNSNVWRETQLNWNWSERKRSLLLLEILCGKNSLHNRAKVATA